MKRHLKRLVAPKSWFIKRKENVFITRPLPGKHSLKISAPLSVVLKDGIGIVKTTREAKKLLSTSEVRIDSRLVKEIKMPVGFMDRIYLKGIDEYYTMTINEKGRLEVKKSGKEEADLKTCKIIGKKVLKNGKTQLNLFDARNIIAEKDVYSVGDSVIIGLPDQKIKKHLKLEKGAAIILSGGKHAGETGTVESIKQKHIIYQNKGGRGVTFKKYAFVIEK